MVSVCSGVSKLEKISKVLLNELEAIFSHGACLNASFLAKDHYTTSAKVPTTIFVFWGGSLTGKFEISLNLPERGSILFTTLVYTPQF